MKWRPPCTRRSRAPRQRSLIAMFRQNVAPQKPVLKTRGEVDAMKAPCQLVAHALKMAREMAKPGVRTSEIDQALEQFYADHKAEPLFKGYPGAKKAFPAATCICVNEQVVHGIPGPRVLRPGDLLKLDSACKLDGWCGDAAVCFPIG